MGDGSEVPKRGRRPLHTRLHPRVAIQVEVTLESDHNFYTGLSENVSEGGLFVATHERPPLGTRLVVRFELLGAPGHIDAVGEVCWLRDRSTPDFPAGFGLRFLRISDESLGHVARFVAGRDSIFYEE